MDGTRYVLVYTMELYTEPLAGRELYLCKCHMDRTTQSLVEDYSLYVPSHDISFGSNPILYLC